MMNKYHKFRVKLHGKLGVFFLTLIICLAAFGQDTGNKQKAYSLDDCITIAINNHPGLNIYKHKTGQKKEKLKAVKAEILPRMESTASYDRLSDVPQAKKSYLGGDNNDFQLFMGISQTLFAGGGIISRRKSAELAVDAAELEFIAAREEIIFMVKTAYFKQLFTRDILNSKKDILKYAELSYKTAFDLNKRTKLPREETLLRLEVYLNEIKQELITAQTSYEIAGKALINVMGLDAGNAFEILDSPQNENSGKNTALAISNNSEILKITKNLKEAEELVKTAKSGYFPQARIRGRYGYEFARLSEGNTDWYIGAAVDFNILGWIKTRSEVNQARERQAEIKSYKDWLVRQKKLEMESACLKYESAKKNILFAEKSIEQARKSLELFEKRYVDSLATSIELMDAQKAFSQAQINYASYLFEMRLAKAEIEKTGGSYYDIK
ncbi:MAG: hypothetical protein A2096_08250 [Spirochaetes bacterium GWF1_41_5]|nr:MAG: hypothetical protein A2096_08250 [Spirochaetes bacterium GWF1_41_5]